MRNKVVLVSGHKGSGKSLFSDILCKSVISYRTLIVPNAEEVKRIARLDFEWDDIKDTRGRQLLVDITNAGYNYDPYFFEKCSIRRYQEFQSLGTDSRPVLFIVPDWRYKCTEKFWRDKADDLHLDVITVRKLDPSCGEGDINNLSEQVIKSESELDNNKFDFYVHYAQSD